MTQSGIIGYVHTCARCVLGKNHRSNPFYAIVVAQCQHIIMSLEDSSNLVQGMEVHGMTKPEHPWLDHFRVLIIVTLSVSTNTAS